MGNGENRGGFLGLDIGPNSIGWALLKPDDQGELKLTNAGVRIFQGGLDDLEIDGKGKSRNVNRREARSRRRIIERRSRRLANLAALLQKSSFLPAKYDLELSTARNSLFEKLDKELRNPYELRGAAIDNQLSLHELGRAIYHLAQRRGFLSNRKTIIKDEKETGIVNEGIKSLQKEIESSDSRTLGEYFAKLIVTGIRIRGRYTSRKMYQNEFNLIWDKQKEYYPEILSDELKKTISRLIFYQRKLKPPILGECELEKGRTRAPKSLLISQQFRFLQTINNIRISSIDCPGGRKLTDEERRILVEKLDSQGSMTFKKMRQILKLAKDDKINLEAGKDKGIPGNTTAAKLIAVFGTERWNKLSPQDKDLVVEDLRSIEKFETAKKRGMSKWGLDDESAEAFKKIILESGYLQFSRQAIEKLMPLLRNGENLQTAILKEYPERFEKSGVSQDILPALEYTNLPSVTNPIVERSLSELRRIVNSIIRKYGKPGFIRLELGRELRQSADQRQRTLKGMRDRQNERGQARERIIQETLIQNPSRDDIDKVLLADECNFKCPYTGQQIDMGGLVGDHPQFDIEHIIPYDRCLDDSFMNRTLCFADENRNIKRGRTPFEAYRGTPKWDEILSRVKEFKGKGRFQKLRRFQMAPKEVEKILGDFTERQLNDMRWSAKRAKKYLGLIYGGINDDGIDNDGVRRIQAVSGPVTAKLRSAWGLNNILADGDFKSRDDHRHHAVDAIAIALTMPAMVKSLSDAAGKARPFGRRCIDFPAPYDGFHGEVENIINNINISFRVSKKVSGALHEESFYSPPKEDENGKYVTIRKPIDTLTDAEVGKIIPDYMRELIENALGGKSAKEAFKDEINHPSITGKNGKTIPIHSVTIRRPTKEIFHVGDAQHRRRYVYSETNHHMEIVETRDKKGQEKWDGYVVSMFEAYRRKINGEPIIKRDFGAGQEFLFSLAKGEIIKLDNPEKGWQGLYAVRKLEKPNNIQFVPITDARKLKDIGRKGFTAAVNVLKKSKCRKVLITPLGETRWAND